MSNIELVGICNTCGNSVFFINNEGDEFYTCPEHYTINYSFNAEQFQKYFRFPRHLNLYLQKQIEEINSIIQIVYEKPVRIIDPSLVWNDIFPDASEISKNIDGRFLKELLLIENIIDLFKMEMANVLLNLIKSKEFISGNISSINKEISVKLKFPSEKYQLGEIHRIVQKYFINDITCEEDIKSLTLTKIIYQPDYQFKPVFTRTTYGLIDTSYMQHLVEKLFINQQIRIKSYIERKEEINKNIQDLISGKIDKFFIEDVLPHEESSVNKLILLRELFESKGYVTDEINSGIKYGISVALDSNKL